MINANETAVSYDELIRSGKKPTARHFLLRPGLR